MELKNAKCPNCGATIKVNPDASVAICMYCQSEYEVQKGIDNYNISHQDVKEQNINGKVNVGTQVVQHQTIINNINRPRKFITVSKATDVSAYKELRYDLIDRRQVEHGTMYEFVFEREDVFSNDRELMAIESKIDTDFNELSNLDLKEISVKNAKGGAIVGIIVLLFIPFVGWAILLFTGIYALSKKLISKSRIKKSKAKLTLDINNLKTEWLDTAARKGLF